MDGGHRATHSTGMLRRVWRLVRGARPIRPASPEGPTAADSTDPQASDVRSMGGGPWEWSDTDGLEKPLAFVGKIRGDGRSHRRLVLKHTGISLEATPDGLHFALSGDPARCDVVLPAHETEALIRQLVGWRFFAGTRFPASMPASGEQPTIRAWWSEDVAPLLAAAPATSAVDVDLTGMRVSDGVGGGRIEIEPTEALDVGLILVADVVLGFGGPDVVGHPIERMRAWLDGFFVFYRRFGEVTPAPKPGDEGWWPEIFEGLLSRSWISGDRLEDVEWPASGPPPAVRRQLRLNGLWWELSTESSVLTFRLGVGDGPPVCEIRGRDLERLVRGLGGWRFLGDVSAPTDESRWPVNESDLAAWFRATQCRLADRGDDTAAASVELDSGYFGWSATHSLGWRSVMVNPEHLDLVLLLFGEYLLTCTGGSRCSDAPCSITEWLKRHGIPYSTIGRDWME